MITVKDCNSKRTIEFELRCSNENGSIESTFVYLKNVIDQGITFGDDILDEIIRDQGKIYEDKGIDSSDTIYRLYNKIIPFYDMTEILPDRKIINIARFMNVERKMIIT